MSDIPNSYLDNVFINCPFDDDYHSFFEVIIFAVHDCGFIARCSKEEDDSGNVRIMKILHIIDECKYGIHDISKADLDATSGLARFNMPFELGLFIGAQRFSPKKHYNSEKKTLILDIEQYRYQKFISDIGGQDIKAHENKQSNLITNIRDFLATGSRRRSIPSGQFISDRFDAFTEALPGFCDSLHWNRNKLTFIDYGICVTEWIKANPI